MVVFVVASVVVDGVDVGVDVLWQRIVSMEAVVVVVVADWLTT